MFGLARLEIWISGGRSFLFMFRDFVGSLMYRPERALGLGLFERARCGWRGRVCVFCAGGVPKSGCPDYVC